jgi:hypothetical protein
VSKTFDRMTNLLPSLGSWARGAWCRAQRRRLVGVTTRVLWVAPDKIPWADWGSEHRFFVAERAGSLVYLRAR